MMSKLSLKLLLAYSLVAGGVTAMAAYQGCPCIGCDCVSCDCDEGQHCDHCED